MKCVLLSRQAVFSAALAATLAGSGFARAQSAPAKSNSSAVSAVYQIALNGFNVGSFRYTSQVGAQSYDLTSDVKLSLLLGAFTWSGVSHTVGSAAGDASLKPASFGFEYSSSLKSGSVRMGFAKGAVNSVSIEPPAAPVPDVVPLKPEHLSNVLDPLSAILALTQDKGSQPCERRLAIFDGKQRFDLQLIYRRDEAIEGTSETAAVCRIKYIPIAGYRQTEEMTNLARTTGIEISFRKVAGAKLFVPQKIVLPTMAGTAEITVQQVEIKDASNGQLALIND